MPRFQGDIPTGFRPPCPVCQNNVTVRYLRDFWDEHQKKVRVFCCKPCGTEWSIGEQNLRADVDEMIHSLEKQIGDFKL